VRLDHLLSDKKGAGGLTSEGKKKEVFRRVKDPAKRTLLLLE
jgi:hypothetical protein